MRYYQPAVLAMFYSQSEKYSVQTDEFEGTVRIREDYLKSQGSTSDKTYLNVAFGFRACTNGEWAIAAYGPDLDKASVDEQRFWANFEIVGEDIFATARDDPRFQNFQKWAGRHLMGDWDIEDGPIAALDNVVKQLNAIAECVANTPLFTVLDIRGLCFPSAQNTHRYQDAHAGVYKLIIDGLNKEAIRGLGDKLGITVKPGDKRTVAALQALFPCEPVRSAVRGPLDQVSEQRRLATHKERPPPRDFLRSKRLARTSELSYEGSKRFGMIWLSG
jgi:hypothetical protein